MSPNQTDIFTQVKANDHSRHRNHFLFSDHYLNELLVANAVWKKELSNAKKALAMMRELYEAEEKSLDTYNESQLESNWIQPVLEILGWGGAYETQAVIPSLTSKRIRKPDYMFFANDKERQSAAQKQNSDLYAKNVVAVGEAKKWGVALNKKQKGGAATFDNNNPSYQIDYYLRATDVRWGILTNGRYWRLINKETSYKLDVYYEIDLQDILVNDSINGLMYFWLFFRQAAFLSNTHGKVFVEEALTASLNYAREVENDLRDNAYKALEQLIQGFFDFEPNALSTENPDDLETVYTNSLYLLYRLLFLMYGESRGLLPLKNSKYKTVSLTAIVDDTSESLSADENRFSLFSTQYWARQNDLFHIINGTSPKANSYYEIPLYNGGLFSPTEHPFLEKKRMGDAYLLKAIDYLATRHRLKEGEQPIKERVDYRTLGVRQLGSIYEGLLEYRPERAAEKMVTIRQKGAEKWISAQEKGKKSELEIREVGELYLATDKGERKSTGSYYTPDYIVRYIVEQTLQPLIDKILATVELLSDKKKAAEFEKQMLALNVLDPAMGSGHFLVAAAEFLALTLTNADFLAPELPKESMMSELERQAAEKNYWLRRVTEACIYGVDKNAMAVELAKLSLWLTTVSADKPLSFLDHHLRHGDSLVGARLSDLVALPTTGKKSTPSADQKLLIDESKLTTDLNLAVGGMMAIERATSDSIEDIHLKEKLFGDLRTHVAKWRTLANVWVSSYFGNSMSPQEYADVARLVQGKQTTANAQQLQTFLDHAAVANNDYFHWELEFPEVFFDEYGRNLKESSGFDAVIGNPPYVTASSDLSDYLTQIYEVSHYFIDLFHVFIERGTILLRSEGEFGLIVPEPWLTMENTFKLRQFVLSNLKLQHIVEFQNKVFVEAVVDTIVLLATKSTQEGIVQVNIAKNVNDEIESLFLKLKVDQQEFLKNEFSRIEIRADNSEKKLIEKIWEDAVKLNELSEISIGIQAYNSSKHTKAQIENRVFHSEKKESAEYLPELKGSDISRYQLSFNGDNWVKYGSHLHDYRPMRFFTEPRLLVREIPSGELHIIHSVYTDQTFCNYKTSLIILKLENPYTLFFFLGLINSALYSWLLPRVSNKVFSESFPRMSVADLRNFPVARIDFLKEFSANVKIHSNITKNVSDMLAQVAELEKLTLRFWLDIEGIVDNRIFTKIHKKSKWEQSIFKAIELAQPFVREDSRSSVTLDASLGWNEDAFKGFIKLLAGKVKGMSDLLDVYRQYAPEYRELSDKIAKTDALIDKLVYQLYGLTEEEIALVEEAVT